MLVDTACLSGAILLIIGTATGMAWGLTQSGFSRSLAAAMTGLPGGAMHLPGGVDRRLRHPGLGPGRHSRHRALRAAAVPDCPAVGIHEVHYAMVVILAMGIGLFAPPFGVGYYAACAIGRVEPAEGMKPILGLHARALHRHRSSSRPCRGFRSAFCMTVVPATLQRPPGHRLTATSMLPVIDWRIEIWHALASSVGPIRLSASSKIRTSRA